MVPGHARRTITPSMIASVLGKSEDPMKRGSLPASHLHVHKPEFSCHSPDNYARSSEQANLLLESQVLGLVLHLTHPGAMHFFSSAVVFLGLLTPVFAQGIPAICGSQAKGALCPDSQVRTAVCSLLRAHTTFLSVLQPIWVLWNDQRVLHD